MGARGSLVVGGYLLEVGGAGGTLVRRGAERAGKDAEPLEQALEGREPRGGADAVDDVVDDASEVTAKVERAVALGKGVAEGRALNPEQLGLEVSTLLDLLERLDRRERWKETLRLARALANLLMLLRRWAELLRTLRAALRAGEKLGDVSVVAWAKHELGTLRLAAGGIEGAERDLHRARELRERIGDRRGLAATNRNLQVLCERLQEMLRNEELVRPRGWPPSPLRLLSLAVLFALLFGGGVAAGVIGSDSDDAGAPTGLKGGGGGSNGGPTNGGDGGTNGTNGGPANGTGDGTGDGADSFPLVVVIDGDGGGTVVGEGVECAGEVCEEDVPAGEVVTLVADPDDESFFQGFSGDCSGTEPCTLAMDAARSVTATFLVSERSSFSDEGTPTEGEEIEPEALPPPPEASE